MLLLCSNTFAWAAATTVHIPLSDELPLTGAQERLIWQRLGKPSAAAARASAPFEPSLYGAVPSSLVLHALPASVTRQIPMARGYKYTSVGGTLLIVNPSDGRIVDIIGP